MEAIAPARARLSAPPASLASALLLSLALVPVGCAHVVHDAREPGVVPPAASCPTEAPPLLPEVARGERGGILFVQFTVESDGSLRDIGPDELDRDPDPLLFAAARDWLKQCKYKPGAQAGKAIAVRLRKGLGFYQPYAIDHADPAPLDWSDAAARDLSAPRITSCLPQDPTLFDSLTDSRLSVVVQRDGRAGDTRLAAHLGEDDPGDYPLAALWLRTCKFVPAKTKAGAPVAARVPLALLFNDGPQIAASNASLPLADGRLIPIPQPTSNCDAHPWFRAPPDLTLGEPPPPIAPIEVEYSVDTEGVASDVILRTPARREVFHAVRRYLLGCRFMPVHDEGGVPLAVRVQRTFRLRLGTRQLGAFPQPGCDTTQPNCRAPKQLGGFSQRIIEGDPP